MRTVFLHFLSELECEELRTLRRNSDFTSALKIPAFERLINLIQDQVPETLKLQNPSYYTVENRPKAHPAHYDGCTLTLQPNHMPWCQYSAVALLSDTFDGGELRFFDPAESFDNSFYRSVVVYSSGANNDPQLHERDSFVGTRDALLIFLATE